MASLAVGTGTPWLRMGVIPVQGLAAPMSMFRQSFCYSYYYFLAHTSSSSDKNNCKSGSKLRNTARTKRCLSISAAAEAGESSPPNNSQVRVRFAPSPTGNLHVGGARTALFNYLFARANDGKFILRIEDTDLDRSTKESEEAVLRDLSWLGLDWDEGPGVGGTYGPYRQSERNALYKQYAEKLVQSGHVYRCFCSNEELEKMKEIAKLKQLPPVYTGKWANATDEEVKEELSKGTPYTYRFRVPKEGNLKINDLIRGEWMCTASVVFGHLNFEMSKLKEFCCTNSAMDTRKRESLDCFLNITLLLETLIINIDKKCISIPPSFFHQYSHEPHSWKDYTTMKSNKAILAVARAIRRERVGLSNPDIPLPISFSLVQQELGKLK